MRLSEIVNIRVFLVSMGIAASVAYGFSVISDLRFWGSFAVIVIAMLANGFLATWEDEQPGGFNNPTDKERETKGGERGGLQ